MVPRLAPRLVRAVMPQFLCDLCLIRDHIWSYNVYGLYEICWLCSNIRRYWRPDIPKALPIQTFLENFLMTKMTVQIGQSKGRFKLAFSIFFWQKSKKIWIAQDFAGTARVQCIPGSFRSISHEFDISDWQQISLCRPAAARTATEGALQLFCCDPSKVESKTKSEKCCRLCFQRMSEFQRHSKLETQHYHDFVGPHLHFSQLHTFQNFSPTFAGLCWAQKNGALNKEPPGRRCTRGMWH